MGRAPTRRGLLAGLLGTAGAPAWLSAAFAAEPPARQVELFATWHAARRDGLPVLAVVIPTIDRDTRGRVVGGILGEANAPLLGLLADYAPVCATVEELHLLGVVLPPDAWFAVVDTATVPARVVPIAGPSPGREWEDDIDRGAGLLSRALAGLRGEDAPSARGQAKVGRERWVTSRLPGSWWANAGGCGLHIEEYDDDGWLGILCGMGSMPARAARFLYFVDKAG